MSTILDVARPAGGSTAMVPRVVNSPGSVREESQVDGLIPTTTNLKGDVLKPLIDEKFPFVLPFSTIKGGSCSAVGIDNYRGGYFATEHLVSLGHKRIGIVAGMTIRAVSETTKYPTAYLLSALTIADGLVYDPGAVYDPSTGK